MVKFDDHQAVNVFGTVNFFRKGKTGFLENPIVVLFFGSLLHSKHVPGTKHGNVKVVLNVIDGGVGGERTVGDVNHVSFSHLVLHVIVEHVVKGVEHNGFVNHSSSNSS